jgi:anti-anti-sigma factor
MSVALKTNETVTVLRLSGHLTLGDMEGVLRTMMDAVIKNNTYIILNFRNVTHVSLNGISKLADRNLRVRSLGGEIKLVGLNAYVTNLFKLVGAYGSFDVSVSEEDALARFES